MDIIPLSKTSPIRTLLSRLFPRRGDSSMHEDFPSSNRQRAHKSLIRAQSKTLSLVVYSHTAHPLETRNVTRNVFAFRGAKVDSK